MLLQGFLENLFIAIVSSTLEGFILALCLNYLLKWGQMREINIQFKKKVRNLYSSLEGNKPQEAISLLKFVFTEKERNDLQLLLLMNIEIATYVLMTNETFRIQLDFDPKLSIITILKNPQSFNYNSSIHEEIKNSFLSYYRKRCDGNKIPLIIKKKK